jgi:hypothetical protein
LTSDGGPPYSFATKLVVTVRRLLEQCPGEPLCDACLAFACSVSLTEMRLVTAAVGHDAPFRRDSAVCASCRRQTTTLAWGSSDVLAPDKCSLCNEPIDAAEDIDVVDADRFHRRCWQRRTTKERQGVGLRPLEGTSET